MSKRAAQRQKPMVTTPVGWRTELLLDGEFVRGDGERLPVENPASEETIITVDKASHAQLDRAVVAARRAFDSGNWRDPELRRNVLLKMADLLESRRAEFTSALIQEIGTPISLCEPIHLGGPTRMWRHFAELAVVDRTISLGPDGMSPESESIIRYEPAGVVGAIGAYNYPLLFVASKAGAALAAGCTAVFMPSPLAPLATLLFGEIAQEAGVPAGVLNLVVGGPDIGRALTEHPGVDKVSFTGSVSVGRRVMIQAAAGIKGVVLELGGKSPGIVLPGADLAGIALRLHGRYVRNAGQGCQSPTRLLVPETQFDEFVDIARDAYTKIPVGDPWDPATMAGPLITEAHRTRVEGYVDRAVGNGGRILAGGGRPDFERGWFMNATLVGGVSNTAEISRNELFGPVAVLMPYQNVDQAVAIANDSELGLGATIYGPLDDAKDVAQRLRVGTVYINGGGHLRVNGALGGFKHSGIGREWGEHGVREFLEPQHIQWAT